MSSRPRFLAKVVLLTATLTLTFWPPASAALDPTFDADGKLVIGVRGAVLDVMTTGTQIVAAGYENSVGAQIAAFRFSSAGVADPAFGGVIDGVLVTDIGGKAVGIAPRASGGYWLGGWTNTNDDFVLVALTSVGQLDLTFGGGDGVVPLDLGGEERAFAMNVDPAGNILLVGSSGLASGLHPTDIAVARFTPEGVPDATFGTGGGVTIDAGALWDFGNDLASTPSGQPVVAGAAQADDGSSEMVVAKFEADGDPDMTFDGDGVRRWTIGGRSSAEAVEIVGSGRILVAATTWQIPLTTSGFNFAITRLTPAGLTDTIFGVASGRTLTNFGPDDRASDMAVLGDGSILVAGSVERRLSDVGLVRYTKRGVADPLFGLQVTNLMTDQFGNNSDDILETLEVMGDGRFILAGTSHQTVNNMTGYWVALARYKKPGIICTRIGTKGDDVMSGGPAADVLCPLGGDDVVRGRGGADIIVGLSGNDRLYGGDGRDRLLGGDGRDLLDGGLHRDTCLGGPGVDRRVSCER